MMHILEADSILLEYGNRRILSDIYIKSETGCITGILGRNGQGKTCLMNIIYGNLETSDKSIRFDHVSLFSPFKRPDLISYLPQFNFIPGSLTLQRIFSDFNLSFGEFEDIFPEFTTKYKHAIKQHSGGQRRLVEVYALIKSRAQFTMLDEPFSYLMPIHIEKIIQILQKEKQKKGLLITDHMYQHILGISNNLYVLKDGKTHLVKELKDIETLGYAHI